jgi:hypothetical protein
VETLLRPGTYAGFLGNFFIAGILCGVCYLIIIHRLVLAIVGDGRLRAAVFLLLMALPVTQLFFGYVEVYGVVTVAVAFYCLSGVRYLRGEIPFTRLPLLWFIAICFHVLSILLVPSLLVLAWHEYRAHGLRRIAAGTALAAAALVFALALIDFDLSAVTATVPHSHFYSWGPSTDAADRYAEAYAGVSLLHANDLFNYLVLMLGPVLVLGVLTVTGKRTTLKGVTGTVPGFLAAAAVPVLIFLAFVKFDLGPAKDWDVLAPYFLPPALLMVSLFAASGSPGRARAVLMVAVATGIQTGGYIALNASTGPALERYQALIDPRTMSNAACYASSHHLALYYHQVGNDAGAVGLWQRYTALFPEDIRGYRNTAINAAPGKEADEILMDRLNLRIQSVAPGDSGFRATYAMFCRKAGSMREANGRLPEAIAWYRKALLASPGDAGVAMKAAQLFHLTGNSDSAVVYYQYSALSGNSAARDSLARLAGK